MINDKLISIQNVIIKINVSKNRIYELIEMGILPSQYKIGQRSLWSENEINIAIQKIKENQIQNYKFHEIKNV